jgi:hypothetical protein
MLMDYKNKWIYNNQDLLIIPDTAIGFVYLITDTINEKYYIGKKLFHSSKTIQKNKKKKRIKVESDWKSYYGSNQILQNVVKENDVYSFTREILHICYSKSECSYLEAKEQFARDVILSPNYYNDWVSCKITRRHMQKFQLR